MAPCPVSEEQKKAWDTHPECGCASCYTLRTIVGEGPKHDRLAEWETRLRQMQREHDRGSQPMSDEEDVYGAGEEELLAKLEAEGWVDGDDPERDAVNDAEVDHQRLAEWEAAQERARLRAANLVFGGRPMPEEWWLGKDPLVLLPLVQMERDAQVAREAVQNLVILLRRPDERPMFGGEDPFFAKVHFGVAYPHHPIDAAELNADVEKIEERAVRRRERDLFDPYDLEGGLLFPDGPDKDRAARLLRYMGELYEEHFGVVFDQEEVEHELKAALDEHEGRLEVD